METLRNKEGFICDMDGVIYHGNRLLPGVKEFVNWLTENKKNFLFLTNSSQYTPRELQNKLARMGLDVDETHFYTSALATACFLDTQSPGCSGSLDFTVERSGKSLIGSAASGEGLVNVYRGTGKVLLAPVAK